MIPRFPASSIGTLLLTVFAAAQLSVGGLSSANAQDAVCLKIGVIDMQECLTKYYRTEHETAKLNEVAKDKRKKLDERNADFMKLNKLLADEDKKASRHRVAHRNPPSCRRQGQGPVAGVRCQAERNPGISASYSVGDDDPAP